MSAAKPPHPFTEVELVMACAAIWLLGFLVAVLVCALRYS